MDELLRDERALFERYALNDAVIAAKYLDQTWSTLEKNFAIGDHKPTLGSIGVEMIKREVENLGQTPDDYFGYRREGRKRHYQDALVDIWPFASNAYHGGRNEAFRLGYTPEGVTLYDLDLKGAYTTAMAMLRIPDWSSALSETRIERLAVVDQAMTFARVVGIVLSDGGVERGHAVYIIEQLRILRVLLDELRGIVELPLGGGDGLFEVVGAFAFAAGQVDGARRRRRRDDRIRRRRVRRGGRGGWYDRLGLGSRVQRAGIDGNDAQHAFAGTVVVGAPDETGSAAEAVSRQTQARGGARIAEDAHEQAAVNRRPPAQRVQGWRIKRREGDSAPDGDDGAASRREIGGDDARLLAEIARQALNFAFGVALLEERRVDGLGYLDRDVRACQESTALIDCLN